jgi:hypothetical protein
VAATVGAFLPDLTNIRYRKDAAFGRQRTASGDQTWKEGASRLKTVVASFTLFLTELFSKADIDRLLKAFAVSNVTFTYN